MAKKKTIVREMEKKVNATEKKPTLPQGKSIDPKTLTIQQIKALKCDQYELIQQSNINLQQLNALLIEKEKKKQL